MRNLSTKVENDMHEKFLEYCNKRGMSVNEALGQIVKFIAAAMDDSFYALPDTWGMRGEDLERLIGTELDNLVTRCVSHCPILEHWWYNVFKQRESGE